MPGHCTVREVAPPNLRGNEWRIRWQFLLRTLRIRNMRTAEGRRDSDSDGYSCLREEHYSHCSYSWLIWMTVRGQSGGVRQEALSVLGEVLSAPRLSSPQRPSLFWREVVNNGGWSTKWKRTAAHQMSELWSEMALHFISFQVWFTLC